MLICKAKKEVEIQIAKSYMFDWFYLYVAPYGDKWTDLFIRDTDLFPVTVWQNEYHVFLVADYGRPWHVVFSKKDFESLFDLVSEVNEQISKYEEELA